MPLLLNEKNRKYDRLKYMYSIAANMFGRKIQLIYYCRTIITRHYFSFYEFFIGLSIET
jgi:hypothetical protein